MERADVKEKSNVVGLCGTRQSTERIDTTL
jgi:hypothetical protein